MARTRSTEIVVSFSDSQAYRHKPWIVYYPAPDGGKRKQKRFSSEKKANAFKLEQQKTLISLGKDQAAISQDGNALSEIAWCRQQLSPFGKSIREVVAEWIATQDNLGKSLTVIEAIEELESHSRAKGLKEKTILGYNQKLNRFALAFGQKKLVEISTRDVSNWINSLDVEGRTRNGYRTALKRLFSYSKKNGYCIENPVLNVEKYKETEPAKAILTIEQTETMFKNLSHSETPIFAIMAFAGMRFSEASQLDWRNVHLESRVIHVPASIAKTGIARDIPITDNLFAFLKPYSASSGLILASYDSDYRPVPPRLKSLGIPWEENILRHSFCSYAVSREQNSALVAEWAGHDVKIQAKHYKTYVTKEAGEKYFSVMP